MSFTPSEIALQCDVINSSPFDKMAVILADDMFKLIFLNENGIRISLKFVPSNPIDNKTAFGSCNDLAQSGRQAITWTNDAQFTDAYMWH